MQLAARFGLLVFSIKWKKLYHLIRPIYSGVSTSTKRLKNADAKAGGQRLSDVEAKCHWSVARSGSQKKKRSGLESQSRSISRS